MEGYTRKPRIDDDWLCPDVKCGNLNFARRTNCNRCGKEKPIECRPRQKKQGFEIGKAAAEKSHGLFSAEDWQCSKCGNVNWARRATCNVCNAPKVGELEERTGYGGGFNEREGIEYIQRDDSEDEYDEFGMKKKKYRNASIESGDSILQNSKNPPKEQEEEDDDDDDSGDLSKYDLWGDDDDDADAAATDKKELNDNDIKTQPTNGTVQEKSRSHTRSRTPSHSRSRSRSRSYTSSSSSSYSSRSSRSRSRSREKNRRSRSISRDRRRRSRSRSRSYSGSRKTKRRSRSRSPNRHSSRHSGSDSGSYKASSRSYKEDTRSRGSQPVSQKYSRR